MRRRPRQGQSIFVHTILLAMGVALALATVNVGLILLRPPPMDPPFTAYEVARVLNGQAIAKRRPNLRVTEVAQPPTSGPATRHDELLREAIAHHLNRPVADVRFRRSDAPSLRAARPGEGGRQRFLELRGGPDIDAERRLYGIEAFNPPILSGFEAALRQSDGRWRIVTRERRDPTERWQSSMIILMLAFLLLVLPIAWLFSKRIARPIRAFAAAAEELGRSQRAEPVEIGGPAEIQLAATALNEMQVRLERYVRERTSMIGAIAHDLRTPLSRLAFHLASAPEPLREKAEAEIAEMERLIAATLEFVQNETHSQAYEPIDLGSLVEGVVDDFADTGQPASLERSASATVMGDPVLLKRLFSNLIRNAAAYGGSAEVSLREEGGWCVIDVADPGPGLAEEELTRVFEPFYRAESSRNRATGGIGLGLAIVRAAAVAHGGTVALFNRPEGGLCARVRLPKAP